MQFSRYFLALAVSAGALTACGSDSTDSSTSSSAGTLQLPPTTNGTDVEAWLAKGSYKNWACETSTHPQIKVSPHGQNRVCSNDAIVGFMGGVGQERPKGSAAVKELYNDNAELVGYAVSVKLADKSDGGANWYWYERVPLSSPAPHDAKGVVADGTGSRDPAKKICVSCHSGAGVDADMHSVNHSSDYVYDVVN